MILREIVEIGLVNDGTEIWIRRDSHLLSRGRWYEDNILEYMNCELKSFTWKDDNNFYVDIK